MILFLLCFSPPGGGPAVTTAATSGKGFVGGGVGALFGSGAGGVASGGASGGGEEAMDTADNNVPRSPAIATKNAVHKGHAFPGTQHRPPHLQMM